MFTFKHFFLLNFHCLTYSAMIGLGFDRNIKHKLNPLPKYSLVLGLSAHFKFLFSVLTLMKDDNAEHPFHF